MALFLHIELIIKNPKQMNWLLILVTHNPMHPLHSKQDSSVKYGETVINVCASLTVARTQSQSSATSLSPGRGASA